MISNNVVKLRKLNLKVFLQMINSTNLKEVLIKYLNLEDIETDEINDNDPLFGEEGSLCSSESRWLWQTE